MATLTVTTNADSGTGSLRQAIADAASGDTIVFDSTVFPAGTTTAIPLASTLAVNKSLAIDAGDPVKSGEGAQLQLTCRVTLDGQNTVRVALTNTANTQIAWHGIKFQNGYTQNNGGGLLSNYSSQNTLTECVFSGNSANNRGGGLLSDYSSQNTLTECVFSGNSAINGGGLFSNASSQNTLTECVFSGNSSSMSGVGLFSNSTSTAKSTLNLNDDNIIDDELHVHGYNSTYTPTLNFSGYNGVAAYTESGTAPTITGSGFLALPPSASVTLPNTITRTVYGAGVSNLTSNNLTLSWLSTDTTKSVLLEKQNSASWDVVSTSATSPDTVLSEGVYRIWDGATFLTTSIVIPQTLVVTNTNATGAGSLAKAVLDARAVDTITFDPSLAGETITLNAGLGPRNEVTIVGLTDSDGNPAITVDGNDNYAFNSSYPVHVSNVAFNGGWGAFSSAGGFDGSTFENCTFENMDLNVFELSNNSQTAESVSFTDCVFSSNDAADILIDGNVNATLNGGNVLTEGLDLTDATTTVITNANYNGVGGYNAPSAGTVNITGSGNIALPDAAVVTVAQTVTRSEFGAGLTGISANELTISWTATDSTKSVLLEVENGADWDTVDDDATSPTTVSTDGKYRVWDGVVFLTIDVTKTRYWQVRAWADMTAGGGGIGDASPAWIVTNKTTGPNLNGI